MTSHCKESGSGIAHGHVQLGSWNTGMQFWGCQSQQPSIEMKIWRATALTHPLSKPGRACPLLGVVITSSSIAWASSWSSEPTSSSSTPSDASKAPPKSSVELESVATSANNFWVELMGKIIILSSCHSPSPSVTTVGKGAGGSQLWLQPRWRAVPPVGPPQSITVSLSPAGMGSQGPCCAPRVPVPSDSR